MEKNKELVRNTIIILLGRFCTQFMSFFLLPLYTNILSSDEYGTYDLIVTYIALFAPVVSLQIEMAIFRELIDARGDNKKTDLIISSGLFSILIQFSICFLIYFLLYAFIDIPYGKLILLNTLAVLVSNIFMQVARGLGENIKYSISSVISGVLIILLNIIFLVILKLNTASILANIIAAVYLYFSCYLYKRIKYSNIKKVIAYRLLKYSLPLVPNGLIWWIINVSDRTIISIFLGPGANGIYAVSNKFSSILMQIFNIFNLSWTESASVHIKDKDRDEFFSNVFNKTLKYSLTACLLLTITLPFIFNMLIDRKYAESYVYIPILLIGMIFNIIVSFLGSIYVAKKLTNEIAKTSLGAGILNIIINLLLIKYIGVYAAAISTVLAFFIMAIFRLIDVQKYVKLRINLREFYIEFILFLISLFLYYFHVALLSIVLIFMIIVYVVYQVVIIIKKDKTS